MKTKIEKLLSLVFVIALAGCVVPNPKHETDPNEPAYIADTASISNSLAASKGIIAGTQPVNPFALPLNGLADAAAAMVTGISVLIAAVKSRKAARQEQAADSLAELVVKTGQQVSALKIAGANGAAPEVARHLDNNSSPQL